MSQSICMSGSVRVLLRTVAAAVSTVSFLVCEASPTAHAFADPHPAVLSGPDAVPIGPGPAGGAGLA